MIYLVHFYPDVIISSTYHAEFNSENKDLGIQCGVRVVFWKKRVQVSSIYERAKMKWRRLHQPMLKSVGKFKPSQIADTVLTPISQHDKMS